MGQHRVGRWAYGQLVTAVATKARARVLGRRQLRSARRAHVRRRLHARPRARSIGIGVRRRIPHALAAVHRVSRNRCARRRRGALALAMGLCRTVLARAVRVPCACAGIDPLMFVAGGGFLELA